MPPTKFPKGLTINDRSKAFDCHVFYDGRDGSSYLINTLGEEVRTWPHTGFPVEMIDPTINGGKRGHVLLHVRARCSLGPHPIGRGRSPTTLRSI